MKVSQIQISDVALYLRLDDFEKTELQMYLDAAIDYVKGDTGLDDDALDLHEDITIAVLALCQDMFDNHTLYIDKSGLNRTVDCILTKYSENIG